VIEIPELGDDYHRMWLELIRLAKNPPAPWTLIGAQMVALHGWATGREPIRPSRDADMLVNVRAVTKGTEQLSAALKDSGYKLDNVSADGIGHQFVRKAVSIDVLAPDGLGERASVRTLGTARTVRVPGGTQALSRTKPLDIRTRSARGSVPTPTLLGAILVKVRAIDVDDDPDAQRQDLAFLLSVVDDPDPLVTELAGSEQRWLQRHAYFSDVNSQAWRNIPGAEDGAIVYRRLTASS
jgi:hypothetical protein